jgi:hypothetical protein
MKERVYVITHGVYSDYGIVAVLRGPAKPTLWKLWREWPEKPTKPDGELWNAPAHFAEYLMESCCFVQIEQSEFWIDDDYGKALSAHFRDDEGFEIGEDGKRIDYREKETEGD